ncbi:MAG: calcium-binding protein [Paracoccaceae bacterium]
MPGKGNGGGNGGGGGGGKPGGGGDGGVNQINGKDKKDDTLIGTDGDDAILGKGGNDILEGRGGNDLLIGGDGDDTLYGGDGYDKLYGGQGDDAHFGGAGDDYLQGNTGSDYMDGGVGYDVASFVEIAPTSADNDGLVFTTAYDSGTGASTYTATNPDTGDVDTVVNVEELRGTNYNDTMTGGDGDDHFVGARGEDTIDGGAGNDTLYGSLDDDEITTGSGSDTLIFLRYNTNGNGLDDDAFALGDSYDVVTDFDVGSDTILFIGNEAVPYTLSSADGGASTLVTYATDSTILLEGVDFVAESGAIIFDYEFVDV